MTKREERKKSYCHRASCELCKYEEHNGGKVKDYRFRYTNQQNVLIVQIVFEDHLGPEEFVAFTADRLSIAHFYEAETYGLTMLANRHNILTWNTILQMTRKEVGDLPEVGKKTLKELDRLLEQFGWSYKPGKQFKLWYEGSIPGIEIS